MPHPLEKRLRDLITRADYRPLNKSELARELDVPTKDRAHLRDLIRQFVDRGDLVEARKGKLLPRQKAGNLITGLISFHPKGHAFVVPDLANKENRQAGINLDDHPRFLVPERFTGTAMHGDRVAIRLQKADPTHPGSRGIKRFREDDLTVEGRVENILERKNKSILGTYQKRNQFRYCIPENKLLPHTVELAPWDNPDTPEPKHGEKIVVAFDDWKSPRSKPRGHVVEILGDGDAPGFDILSIIYQYQLPLEFPADVEAEAAAIPIHIPPDEIAKREDWRDRFVFTIDPEDARDYDDALCITPLENGQWELAVHIADVSHYVRPGSALDREALRRGNSTYLVDRVIPMLPEKLSNGVCSLVPREDRLTRAAILTLDNTGKVIASRFAACVIHSRLKLAYEEAFERLKPLLKNPGATSSDEVTQHLFNAWTLAAKVRKRRFEHGALDLDFPEVRVKLDPQGNPTGFDRVEYDESHQLIEEFMLLANEAVATLTQKQQAPSLYRIHEDPDADRLFEYRELVRLHGFKVGDLTVRDELQQLLKMIRGSAEEQILKIGLLKSLKRAAYHADCLGHYGLAKANYTHFTSPIRRYCDLIVHRVLGNLMLKLNKNEEGGVRAVNQANLPSYAGILEAAQHISETERNSADAERDSVKLKELEYLYRLSRAAKPPKFKAVILEISRMGMFVEMSDFFIKGVVKREDLPQNADWFLDLATQRITGRHPKIEYRPSQEIEVEVARVDLEKKFVDFRVAGSGGKSSKSSPPSKRNGQRRDRRRTQGKGRPPKAKKKSSSRKNPSKKHPSRSGDTKTPGPNKRRRRRRR
ncbi:MAG: ribonuclease R [Verrucomicrobiota bacterium]